MLEIKQKRKEMQIFQLGAEMSMTPLGGRHRCADFKDKGDGAYYRDWLWHGDDYYDIGA